MNNQEEINKSLYDFIIRVSKGDCTDTETYILPEIIKQYNNVVSGKDKIISSLKKLKLYTLLSIAFAVCSVITTVVLAIYCLFQ